MRIDKIVLKASNIVLSGDCRTSMSLDVYITDHLGNGTRFCEMIVFPKSDFQSVYDLVTGDLVRRMKHNITQPSEDESHETPDP